MHKHTCVVCLKDVYADDPPQPGAKFLCHKCFKRVQKAHRKKQDAKLKKRPQ